MQAGQIRRGRIGFEVGALRESEWDGTLSCPSDIYYAILRGERQNVELVPTFRLSEFTHSRPSQSFYALYPRLEQQGGKLAHGSGCLAIAAFRANPLPEKPRLRNAKDLRAGCRRLWCRAKVTITDGINRCGHARREIKSLRMHSKRPPPRDFRTATTRFPAALLRHTLYWMTPCTRLHLWGLDDYAPCHMSLIRSGLYQRLARPVASEGDIRSGEACDKTEVAEVSSLSWRKRGKRDGVYTRPLLGRITNQSWPILSLNYAAVWGSFGAIQSQPEPPGWSNLWLWPLRPSGPLGWLGLVTRPPSPAEK